MAYLELKKAINCQIPDNADPSPAVNNLLNNFKRLKDMEFAIPDKIQILILLARLPPSMEFVVNTASNTDFDEIRMDRVREMILLQWEQKSGKHQPPPQKAQKITAVKRGSDNAPAFSEQQVQDKPKKKNR
jgi:hypothetical protein